MFSPKVWEILDIVYFAHKKERGRFRMRLISLRQYSIITIQSIRNTTTLHFSEILDEVDSNPVLYGPVLCYYFATKKKPGKKCSIYDEIIKIKERGITTQESFFDYVQASDNNLLKEFVNSYVSFNEERDQTEVKNQCRYFVQRFHDEKGISYYRMCKDVGIQHGNLYMFISRGKNDRLSWSKCLKLLNYLNQDEQKE